LFADSEDILEKLADEALAGIHIWFYKNKVFNKRSAPQAQRSSILYPLTSKTQTRIRRRRRIDFFSLHVVNPPPEGKGWALPAICNWNRLWYWAGINPATTLR
jgi:hypothetical protein